MSNEEMYEYTVDDLPSGVPTEIRKQALQYVAQNIAESRQYKASFSNAVMTTELEDPIVSIMVAIAVTAMQLKTEVVAPQVA